jgi:hypothetical protein
MYRFTSFERLTIGKHCKEKELGSAPIGLQDPGRLTALGVNLFKLTHYPSAGCESLDVK